jgi:uncharacterized membrane protein
MNVPATHPTPAASSRLAAIDWMRGVVMLLMAVDHSAGAFNAGRLITDSAFLYNGAPLPLAQFLTRWVTHLCAPTFVFLAGCSLALSVSRRIARGESARTIDRHIVLRGLFLASLDPIWMSLGFFGYRMFILQVLYAIGLSFVAMALLRRAPPLALVGGAIAILVGVDGLAGHLAAAGATGGPTPLIVGALASGGRHGRLILGYPVLPWLAIMMLGWAFGQRLAEGSAARPGRLLLAGLAALGLFVVLRGLDGFGNAGLHRTDGSLVQWLHVSKYPPSLSFCALELGLMSLGLAAFFRLQTRDAARPAVVRGVLSTFGASALFFYLLHAHLLEGASLLLGMHARFGVGAAWLGAAAVSAALYLPCRWYVGYKRTHDNLITRYV